jgi:hypothetical protein
VKGWRVALLLACSAMAAAAMAAQPRPVKLSAQDRSLLVAAACASMGAKDAEHIAATTGARGATSIEARVQCRPHRSEAALPVAHLATCHNRAGKWSCAGQDALRTTVRDATVWVVARDIPASVAVDVVSRASKMTYPPFTEPAWPIFQGTCSVGVIPSPNRAGLTRYAIECAGGTLEMDKLCWKEGCTHFNASGDRARP